MNDEIVETAKATQEIAKATVKGLEVSEKVGGFFAKVLGEPIETATGILGDKLKFMRWERQVRLVDRVQQINRNRCIEGKEIPVSLKLAIPIIENASIEEDDLLQDLWARLMSSAQGEESSNTVRSAFIDIIKQLEVIDIQILNTMFNDYVKTVGINQIHNETPRRVSFAKTDIINTLKISDYVYEDSVDNLMRVRCLCSELQNYPDIAIGKGHHATINRGYDSLCLTTLGVRFIVACVR